MIFDCGEGTQHQLLRGASVRHGRIARVLITHVHGDHLFGLPGLVTGLCVVKTAVRQHAESVGRPVGQRLRIYGPRGVRNYLMHALMVSRMRIRKDFLVHELVETRREADDYAAETGLPLHDAHHEPECDSIVAPVAGPDGALTWPIAQREHYTLDAGFLKHTVPCWGYVFGERDQVGTLDMAKLAASPLGSLRVGPWLRDLKAGQPVTAPDGSVVTHEHVCGPPLQGRRVAVLGDTCDASAMAHLVRDCSLLVHECTMLDHRMADAARHGHSSPTMVARFARAVRAREVAVTHFGGEIAANEGGKAFADIAHAFKHTYGKAPLFARDFMTLHIGRDGVEVQRTHTGVKLDAAAPVDGDCE